LGVVGVGDGGGGVGPEVGAAVGGDLVIGVLVDPLVEALA